MTVYTTIMNMINITERTEPQDWIKKFTLHEQASSTEFDIKDLTRVVEMVYSDGEKGKTNFDSKEALAISRTRVMSTSETISGRDEDEAWLSFLSKYPIYARK